MNPNEIDAKEKLKQFELGYEISVSLDDFLVKLLEDNKFKDVRFVAITNALAAFVTLTLERGTSDNDVYNKLLSSIITKLSGSMKPAWQKIN